MEKRKSRRVKSAVPGPVFLRALEMEDLERTHVWHNDSALYATLVGPFRRISRAAEEQWLKKNTEYSNTQVALAICIAPAGAHIGNIYLRNIDAINRHAEVGLFIADPKQRGKGYGEGALRLLIAHAFGDLGLRRLHLTVLPDNRAAIHVYEKCGFAIEGTLREHVFKKGRFRDLLVMGLLAPVSPSRS